VSSQRLLLRTSEPEGWHETLEQAFPPAQSREVSHETPRGTAFQGNRRRARKYYAVAVGKRPGIYDSWLDAADQVVGYSGSVNRWFRTRAEAEFYMSQFRDGRLRGE
jgi:hypothetical protein